MAKPRGPVFVQPGMKKGQRCCHRVIVSDQWKFCPFCGVELDRGWELRPGGKEWMKKKINAGQKTLAMEGVD